MKLSGRDAPAKHMTWNRTHSTSPRLMFVYLFVSKNNQSENKHKLLMCIFQKKLTSIFWFLVRA